MFNICFQKSQVRGFKNPFDIRRDDILQQAARMRTNFFHIDAACKRLHEEGNKLNWDRSADHAFCMKSNMYSWVGAFFRLSSALIWSNGGCQRDPRNRKTTRNFGKNRTKMNETANRRNIRDRKTAWNFWENRKRIKFLGKPENRTKNCLKLQNRKSLASVKLFLLLCFDF